MTAKDKAQELVEKFYFNVLDRDGTGAMNRFEVKQCAFIAVDEIIESKKLEYLFTFQEITLLKFTKDDRLVHSKFINYWQEVKDEIKKL